MSLGKPITESCSIDPLCQAVEMTAEAGFIVVVAAGNYGDYGTLTITSPGNAPSAITVGSITDNETLDDFTDDFVSTFSSMGPTAYDLTLKPDLLAPGNLIQSTARPNQRLKLLTVARDKGLDASAAEASVDETLAKQGEKLSKKERRALRKAKRAARRAERRGIAAGICDQFCEENYMALSGTSMATAVVSGAVALMLDQDPDLSAATVKARLMRSARKIEGDPIAVGAGVLDVAAALEDVGIATDAKSPGVMFTETGAVVLQDVSALWGPEWSAAEVWNGDNWSDSEMDANGYLWATGYMWANG
jgi:serine protease AprX